MGDSEDDKFSPKPPPAWIKKMRRPQIWIPLVIIVLLILTPWFYYLWYHVSTDDAYIAGHIHNINSRVPGTVIQVLVDDNQWVKQGQPLLRLDPTDYQVRVDEAHANHTKAKADLERILPLRGDEAISQQDFDDTTAAEKITKAKLADAENQLSYCTIYAPTDGRIGRKQVETGNHVTQGAALMAVVQDLWVVANFKETQMTGIKPGQKVNVEIDAIGGKTFTGRVDSFSPGTGAAFALLPPDNATGNFTKIVQRVPVKIMFDPDSIHGYEDRIVPGLSVIATVDLKSK